MTTVRQRKPARAGVSAVVMREVPGSSAVHRLWAGTKLLCAALLVIVTVVFPGWPAAASGAVVILAAAVLAGVPRTALPRVPAWVWIFVLVTAGLSLLGSGLALYLRSVLITVVLLGSAAVVTWTTPVSQITPAVAVLAAPSRKLRLPVDEWVVTVGLCLRCLPLLFDECRVLFAARRLRPAPRTGRRRWSPGVLWAELVDVLTAVLAVSTRRAAEVGQAVTARGGLPHPVPVRPALSRSDAVAFAVVVAACCVTAILSL